MAVVGDTTVTVAELDALASERLARLRNEEYTIRKQVLEEHITRLLLEKEAAARHISVSELTEREIASRVSPVTEDQKRAVYESTGNRTSAQSETQALAQIETNLKQSRMAEARRRFVSELRAKTNVRVLLDPARVAVDTDHAPAKGPVNAPVTIVEFSDFQCPYCRSVVDTLRRIETEYANRVRFVFRDFPLPSHMDAPKAAEAAACANEQGQFWKMHDVLFADRSTLHVSDLKRRATAIGLNAYQFDQCLDSGKYAVVWQFNRALGQRYGVSATPTFFINGRFVAGALPYEAFREIIDDELARNAGQRNTERKPSRPN